MIAPTPATQVIEPIEGETELSSPEFSCWITINEIPQPVYGITDDLKSSKGSIESKEGAEFKVHFRDDRVIRNCGVTAALVLDGEQSESFFIRPENTITAVEFKGKRIADTVIRPFTFSQIQLTDDLDKSCENETIVKALGTIKLTVLRANLNNSALSIPRVFNDNSTSKLINERSKKAALSHSTSLGAAAYAPAANTCQVHYIDNALAPYFVFEFSYRSRDLLEIAGLIPAAEPIAGPSNPKKRYATTGTIVIDSDDSDDEEVEDNADELTRLRAENARLKRVKLEGGAGVKEEKKPKLEKDVKPIEKGEILILDD